jgi:hypothetical protein
MDVVCPKCGVDQKFPSILKRHLSRKTPCAPIVLPEELSGADRAKKYGCKYCGRTFTTATSMYRHVRLRCKIANNEGGMDKLFEHTLERQMAAHTKEVSDLKTQVGRLTELLEKQLTLGPPEPAKVEVRTEHAGQVNTGAVTNNTQIINITPWDGDRRIAVGIAEIAAAFAENGRLKEYARLGDHELADPEIAPPYVTELFMDLTKRAHADPAARNVYLNPRRADQALVHMKSGKWEVLPLSEATRLMFDGVAQGILEVSRRYEEGRQLPLEAQNALAMAGLLYDDEPDEYAKQAKAPMSAHLSNTKPGPGD